METKNRVIKIVLVAVALAGTIVSISYSPKKKATQAVNGLTFERTALRTGQVGARKLNSIMPWGYFRNMTDDDLKAIYAYLRTLPPVQHRVDNTEFATACTVCGGRHGFGDKKPSE